MPNLFLTSDLTTVYRPKRTVEGMNWTMPRFMLSFLLYFLSPFSSAIIPGISTLLPFRLSLSFLCVPGRSYTMPNCPCKLTVERGCEAQAEMGIIARAYFFLYYSHALCALQYYPINIHKVYWQPRRDKLQVLKATQRMD